MTSPLLDTVTTAKRESVLSAADGKWKIIKLNKFNDNTLIPLEPTETRMDTECVFDCALRNPLGHSEILPNSSFNNFTIRMRLKLAQSFGIDCAFILPVREIHRIASNYYTSLQMQLNSYFGVYVSLCSVKPDGNCLRIPCTFSYNSRNQEYYDILKSKQIAKFVACHNYHFNFLLPSTTNQSVLRERRENATDESKPGWNTTKESECRWVKVSILICKCIPKWLETKYRNSLVFVEINFVLYKKRI